jgi:uncharacterized damage-inducible protein DinB
MYRRIDDFLADWKQESEGTLKLLGALTDASLSQKVCAEGRTLGFIAWHLVLTLGEMPARAGLIFDAPPEDSPEPSRAAGIVERYRSCALALAEKVRESWTDAQLDDDLSLYGSTWKKGAVLSTIISHEAHHRGQMTVLMRQAGIKVPGVCGPSREEWAMFGMEAQR